MLENIADEDVKLIFEEYNYSKEKNRVLTCILFACDLM
jgi:hypothetical protein